VTLLLYTLEEHLWPTQKLPATPFGLTWAWLGFLWAFPFLPAAAEFTGLMTWKAPSKTPLYIPNLVCYRVVSKGINKEALRDTIYAIRREMHETPLFPYVIEVVLDSVKSVEGLPKEEGNLHYIVVPENYQLPSGTKAKARSLNYALYHSPLKNRVWLLHCDEETHPTRSSIIGVANAISEEEHRATKGYAPRIGQGIITYHRLWKDHPFFTLSDAIRTGSDLGRLYFAMGTGIPLFGLHGSYILVRNDVERDLSMDVGRRGSLTEDAWWGTLAMEAGYRCRWVEGNMSEQCTHKPKDFIKQRRRWFCGMYRTAFTAPASIKYRASLMTSMTAWGLAPLAWVYTVAHLILGGYVPPEIRALANISLAVYIATTIIGLRVNMTDHGITKRAKRFYWEVVWLFCLPFFSLLEATAVTYAIVRPEKDFFVVEK
jgi:egghead protein (zeste-white 4 protein)